VQLHYLDFDFSDEESGRGSFDAMATVAPSRLSAVLAEISAVLDWARGAFGPAGALQDESEWDYELQDTGEPVGAALSTVTLTLSGSPAFCQAFREEFGVAD
jgi:hypothetical protein